jgi:hypothetical protein
MTDRTALLGSWKLVSTQLKLSDTGEIINLYGPDPLGFLLFHPCGRMMILITPSGPRNRLGFTGGYTGKYRIRGDTLFVQVDVATHPSQAGTEQLRLIRLAGDTLTLITPEQAFVQYGGRVGIGTVVWERERELTRPRSDEQRERL